MKRKYASRSRIYPYLERRLASQLAEYCAATKTSESVAVATAVRQLIEGTSDRALLFRRLDRLHRAVFRVGRDLEVLSHAFGVFVRLWFAHTPNIPEDMKRTARANAEKRYQQFIAHVGDQYSHGLRFIDDLPREAIADDGELDSKLDEPPPPDSDE